MKALSFPGKTGWKRLVQGLPVYAARALYQAVDFFLGTGELLPEKIELSKIYKNHSLSDIDFSDVMGQEHVKRAMEVAAAIIYEMK